MDHPVGAANRSRPFWDRFRLLLDVPQARQYTKFREAGISVPLWGAD
jgi:hypothetical protein